jgi:opacity protein-like surface antigen
MIVNRSLHLLAAATVGRALASIGTAYAGTMAQSQEVEICAGELFGDRLTYTEISDLNPKRNDNVLFGARYQFNVIDQFGMQLSPGYSPSRAARVASGDTNLGVTTVDLDAVLNIPPNERLAPYALAGAGFAHSSFDHHVQGTVGGNPADLSDASSVLLNWGVGAKYLVSDNVFVDVGARYRYIK